jgi:hypothetical protein
MYFQRNDFRQRFLIKLVLSHRLACDTNVVERITEQAGSLTLCRYCALGERHRRQTVGPILFSCLPVSIELYSPR